MEDTKTMSNSIKAFIASYEDLFNSAFKEMFDIAGLSKLSDAELQMFNKTIGIMASMKDMMILYGEVIDRIDANTIAANEKLDRVLGRSTKESKSKKSECDFMEINK